MTYHKNNRYSKCKRQSSVYKTLALTLIICMGFFVFYKFNSYSSEDILKSQLINSVDYKNNRFTLRDRINKKVLNLKLQKDIKSQKAYLNQFSKPSVQNKNIDLNSSDEVTLDMGIRFSNHSNIKSVFKDLDEKSFENDIYVDPENHIRRQVAHQDFIEEYQRNKTEAEQKEWIKNFVRSANAQGYKVHFKKNMEVVLEPIELKKEEIQPINLILE